MKVAMISLAICLLIGLSYQQTPGVIIDSKVPNIEYELNAVQSYYQASILYPTNSEKQLQAFALLYNDTHPTPKGWKVAQGCSGFYNPSEQYFVLMNVTTSNSTSKVVRVFN
ncbi:unnamed protein product [Psylliodes chrysocephalus]|uniref:Uncharacterized protein n=1 Tax=Psylliodes chrysocephalus TaxID=3402493 RepID=A0A9P0D1X3_9CUCU|nr:unnamed protein product [Psylliodes chrysocephala]